MPLSFPLSLATFADLLKIESVEWSQMRSDEISGLGSGQVLAAELADPVWYGKVFIAPLSYDDDADVSALIEALDGSINDFYMGGFPRLYPRNDPTGSILGANVVTIASVSNGDILNLAGLPAGYVLSRGDFLSFDVGSQRVFHRIVFGATAAGDGTASIQIRPHYFSGIAGGTVVTLKKPSAKCIMVPNTYNPGRIGGQWVQGKSFDVIQKL